MSSEAENPAESRPPREESSSPSTNSSALVASVDGAHSLSLVLPPKRGLGSIRPPKPICVSYHPVVVRAGPVGGTPRPLMHLLPPTMGPLPELLAAERLPATPVAGTGDAKYPAREPHAATEKSSTSYPTRETPASTKQSSTISAGEDNNKQATHNENTKVHDDRTWRDAPSSTNKFGVFSTVQHEAARSGSAAAAVGVNSESNASSTSRGSARSQRRMRRRTHGMADVCSRAMLRSEADPLKQHVQWRMHSQLKKFGVYDRVRIHFEVDPEVMTASLPSKVYICCLRFGGLLSKFHLLEANGRHEEFSFVGRSIMIVTLPKECTTMPTTVKQLDLKSQVLLIYTCKLAPSRRGELVHVVRLQADGEAFWRALRLDGSNVVSHKKLPPGSTAAPLPAATTDKFDVMYDSDEMEGDGWGGVIDYSFADDDDDFRHNVNDPIREIVNPKLRGNAIIDGAAKLCRESEDRYDWCSDIQHTTGNEVLVRFVLAKEGPRLPPNVRIFLCWVDPEGRLKASHFRELTRERPHDEYSFEGHRFLVLRLRDGEPRPTNIDEVDVQAQVLWLYYEAKAPHPELMHVVTLRLDNGTASFMATVLDPDELRICVGCSSAKPADGDAPHWLPRSGPVELPPPSEPWTIEHMFMCPPLPPPDFDSYHETLYVWGDTDFDVYSPRGCFPLHDCLMNQIVPQVMIGRCLCANQPETYKPIWGECKTWVVQAQYYWQNAMGEGEGSHALCGRRVHVKPGEFLKTRIEYDPELGSLDISIGPWSRQANGIWVDSETRRSRIVSQRPFPETSPALFTSWREFFERAVAKSRLEYPSMGLLCRPKLNIEYKGSVRLETLAALCPFVVAVPKVNGIALETRTRLYSPSVSVADLVRWLPCNTVLYIDD